MNKMRFILAVAVAGLLCFDIISVSGDIGTAIAYNPPYLPTRCGGYDQEQFPEGGLFAAASDGVWDNGAACGRRYRLKCISGQRKPCKNGSIVIQVVDVCRTNPCQATLTLSNKAFDAISRDPNAKINVEYSQI
ncbi:EG45-like domain containing protein [Rhododendron vialii]|uniref:EG45-like domain containing protein n=1 Tax=Rhododendron vialii TaxID=182163 RepID=UPI00265D8754|nr:EG45-like domain containing protein [Rhododendron vialii]